MTLTEKILAAHTDKEKVSPGEFINVRLDMILANDVTAPIAIREFRRIGVDKVFDPKKIVMVADHFVPNKDITSAENARLIRLSKSGSAGDNADRVTGQRAKGSNQSLTIEICQSCMRQTRANRYHGA